jgi:hypothetical protein
MRLIWRFFLVSTWAKAASPVGAAEVAFKAVAQPALVGDGGPDPEVAGGKGRALGAAGLVSLLGTQADPARDTFLEGQTHDGHSSRAHTGGEDVAA